MTTRFILAIVSTIAVLAGSVVYLAGPVLHTRVFEPMTTVTIDAPRSNGVHAGSAVVYRGLAIGDVRKVEYSGRRVAITVAYDAKYAIPVGSSLRIENQSMLGESAVVLLPESGEGPVITSGQTLTAEDSDVPASVPELLGSAQTMLGQVSPDGFNELVAIVRTALAGTEGALDRLAPAAELVAATMIYSQPAVVDVLRNTAPMLADGTWIGPSLRPERDELLVAGGHLSDVITHVKPFADYTEGGKIIGERWKPTLERSADMVGEVVPPISRLAQTLVPAAQRDGRSIFAQVNIADLMEQAMRALPGDSLRLVVRSPR